MVVIPLLTTGAATINNKKVPRSCFKYFLFFLLSLYIKLTVIFTYSEKFTYSNIDSAYFRLDFSL